MRRLDCPFCHSPCNTREVNPQVFRIGLGPTANVSHFISCQQCGTSGLVMVRGEMFPKDPPHDKEAELQKVREMLLGAVKEVVLKAIREYDNPNEIRGYN